MTNDELIHSFYKAIPNEFVIDSIIDNGNGTATIYTGFTAWALLNYSLNVNGTSYVIKEIERDYSITVEGLPSGDSYTLELPFFTYGTPKQVDIEREKKRQNGTFVTPMFYLFAPITETSNSNQSSTIAKTLNFNFAVLSNYTDKQFTADIIEESIKAMRGLTDLFMYVLGKQINYIDTDNIQSTIKEYPKYAQYFDKGGAKKNIFSENLSGVEAQLTIQVKKEDCSKKKVFTINDIFGSSLGELKTIDFSGRDCLTNEWKTIGVSFIPSGAKLDSLEFIGRVDNDVIENIEIKVSLEDSNGNETIFLTKELFSNEDILDINRTIIKLNNYEINSNSVVVVSRRAIGNLEKTHYWTRNAYLNYKIF